MEEWKAKLAEQDADVELVAPKSIPAKNQILTGSVVMDDIFTPTPQEKVESGNFKPQDMMHAMPTEDLIMLACDDTFLDTAIAPAPASTHQIQSDHYQAGNNATTLNKAVTPELVYPLDTDCQDFLMSAFGI